MMRVRYVGVDNDFLYYVVECYGIPEVKGRIGFGEGRIIHIFEVLHTVNFSLKNTLLEIEKTYSEQGLNLLAIACEQSSKERTY